MIFPAPIVPAPEIFPEESMTIDGVLRKFVNPVAEEILIPLTVPPAAAEKESKFEVFPELVAAFSEIKSPVAVLPAPPAEF